MGIEALLHAGGECTHVVQRRIGLVQDGAHLVRVWG